MTDGVTIGLSGGSVANISVPSAELGSFVMDEAYRFGFTSRTGGATADMDVDDLTLSMVTDTALVPTAVPEPDEWFGIASFGIILFAVIRRRCQSVQTDSK